MDVNDLSDFVSSVCEKLDGSSTKIPGKNYNNFAGYVKIEYY